MQNTDVIGQIFHESSLAENDVRSVKRISKDRVKMEVVLQDVDSTNRNGRVYPKRVVENALKSEFITEKLRTKSLLGEANHPMPGSGLARQMMVDMSNVSHVIKEHYWDPKDSKTLLGIVETAGTGIGRDLAGLILENGMECSFSMRGAGDVIKKGAIVEVADPLKIITWDCVHFPSHKAAYMRSIVNESAPVTTGMLAAYIAEQSQNLTMLTENIECFAGGNMAFSIESGKVLITEKATGKLRGYANLEEKLNTEYRNILSSIRNS